MRWLLVYFYVFDLSFLLALLLTPMCRRFARSWGYLDQADPERKSHTGSLPLLGGLAVFGAIALNILFNYGLGLPLAARFAPESLAVHVPDAWAAGGQLIVLMIAAAAMLGLGLYDDKHDLRAGPKLVGQLVVASVVWWAGMRITLATNSSLVSYLLTVVWIVAVTNALNYLDIMDGLCTGVGLVAALVFAFLAGLQGQYLVCVLALALAGALLGFWPHNFKPATIFLGDAGSHFIGFMLAVLPLLIAFYQEEIAPTRLVVLIPLLVLAVPLYELILVSWRCWRRHHGLGGAEPIHLAQRLVKLGLPESWAVVLICLLSLILGLGAVVLLWLELAAALVLFLQAICLLAMISLLGHLGRE